MGEVCRCAHCKVIVNSGEFDWILAEITQRNDYGAMSSLSRHVSPDLPEAVNAITSECADFSMQMAEDKASNAFMQIMTAIATRNPACVRRFVTDEVFAEISAMITDQHVVFNRIYLNESVLLSVSRGETKRQLEVGLSCGMQRVEVFPDGRLSAIDEEIVRTDHLMRMERDIEAAPQAGSLYQHQCPNCGGAIGDTVDVNCQYCGTPLNSTRGDWIVSSFGALE
jgi:hypothetical protein